MEAPLPNGTRQSFVERLGSFRLWWTICIAVAGLLAWDARHAMNPDGLSYLDIASETVSSGPSALINGCWSPAYPALISLLMMFRPAPIHEFPLLHLVNLIVFILALAAFSFFLRKWSWCTNGHPLRNEEQIYWVPFGFCSFLWFILQFIGLRAIGPDLGVAAVVFLAAGLTCRLFLPEARIIHYTAFGSALALGYYTKAAMFPIGIAFLAVLFLLPPSISTARRNLLVSLATFLAGSAPLIGAMSNHEGKLSFGEAGRLNYAWHVNGLQNFVGWTGESGDVFGTPQHPPRKLAAKPTTLEFATPIQGTYPLWYDPSYWYAGSRIHFSFSQQVSELRDAARVFKNVAVSSAAYVGGAIVLLVLNVLRRTPPLLPRRLWWSLVVPLVAFGSFALVHVEERYVAAFVVLFGFAVYSALMSRADPVAAVPILATVVCVTMFPFGIQLAATAVRVTTRIVHPVQPDYQAIAEGLAALGVKDGDRLAIIGNGFDPYYARYARLRVAAQIPDPEEVGHLTSAEWGSVSERLAAFGVRAVVAKHRPSTATPAEWHDIEYGRAVALSVALLPDPLAK